MTKDLSKCIQNEMVMGSDAINMDFLQKSSQSSGSDSRSSSDNSSSEEKPTIKQLQGWIT